MHEQAAPTPRPAVKMRAVTLMTFVSVVASAGVVAQPAPRMSAIDAVVTDSALKPVAGVTVALVGTSVRLATGANGRFVIQAMPAGQFQLAIQKLGYLSLSPVVDVGDADTLRLAFILEAGRSLGGVAVTEKRRSLRLAAFDERREKGGGQFITAEEIEKRNTPFATELFRTFRGMTIKGYPDGASGIQYYAMNPRSGTRDLYISRKTGNTERSIIGCPMEVFVDGLIMATPFNLDHLPNPSSIAGVEVYSGPAAIPLKYGGGDRRCGAILVWTKDGT